MVRKPLPSGYAQSFSQRFISPFFSGQSQASGQELLQISPVNQVNKLLVQQFYGLWQAETKNLRSPYFDFDNPQVKDALKAFMNVLSRHIAIKQAELEPLLANAVQAAATLALEPLAYFKALANSYTTDKDFGQALRYVSWQPAMVKFLQNANGDAAQRVAALQAELSQNRLQAEQAGPYIKMLHDACPLPSEFWGQEQAISHTEDDFFSSAWANGPDEPLEENKGLAEPAQPHTQAPVASGPLATPEPQAEAPAQPVATSPATLAQPTAPKISVAHENGKPSLNDRFSGQSKPQPTIAEKLKKGGSIRNHISLNQRFMFVKELFGGNTQDFNATLDEIDKKGNLAEADHYIQREVANTHNWPQESEAIQEFQNVLELRFG